MNTKLFEVIVVRYITKQITIKVQATDELFARGQALELLAEDACDSQWEECDPIPEECRIQVINPQQDDFFIIGVKQHLYLVSTT